MKKNQTLIAIILAAILFMPIFALANSTSSNLSPSYNTDIIAPRVLEDGFYLGVAGGYDIFAMKNELQLSALNSTFASMDPKINIEGIFGGTFIGYGKYFEPYRVYLGAEFFINGNNASDNYDTTFNQETITTEMSVIANYGLSLLPGIHLNPRAMLYLRLGYNWMKINVDETYFYQSFPYEYHQFGTLHGFNFGAGIETVFYHQLNFRLEYNHTQYNALNTHLHASVTPADNQLNVGLVYHLKH